jgi:D-aminopeptidase
VLRTVVTVVQTRPGGRRDLLCHGATTSFNGNGEMTGTHWLAESGLLRGPVGITNTHQVGLVRDALVRHVIEESPGTDWCLPIVAETYDGFLSDIGAFGLTVEHVHAALEAADLPGRVDEGSVGGGTGMICHGFKGGIGTSSRQVDIGGDVFTVGVLVQANYGSRRALRLDGRPIGATIGPDIVALPTDPATSTDAARTADAGSIIVIVATDAPLLADQCARLARRATVGLARVGGTGANGSGDLFLAFSTHNEVSATGAGPFVAMTLGASAMTPLFDGVIEAVEESIWNALVAAGSMTGFRGRTVQAIPHDLVRRAVSGR